MPSKTNLIGATLASETVVALPGSKIPELRHSGKITKLTHTSAAEPRRTGADLNDPFFGAVLVIQGVTMAT